jgi:hypothetical protein
MAAPISLRGDFDGPMLRAPVLAEKAGVTRRACFLSSRVMTAARARTRLCSGAWGSRPFAIGASASISGGRMASSMARPEAHSRRHGRGRSDPAVHGVVRGRLIGLAQWAFDEYGPSVSKQTLI